MSRSNVPTRARTGRPLANVAILLLPLVGLVLLAGCEAPQASPSRGDDARTVDRYMQPPQRVEVVPSSGRQDRQRE